MTFEEWWAKEFPNVNIQWYENSSDALTKEWFNIVKQAFEDGKSTALVAKDARIAELEGEVRRLDAGWHEANKQALEQKLAATPSEDGGEVPDELDLLLDWFEGLLHSYDWLGTGSDQAFADREKAEAWEKWERLCELVECQEDQHSRIVAAKDAEIFELRQHKNDYMEAAEETARALLGKEGE